LADGGGSGKQGKKAVWKKGMIWGKSQLPLKFREGDGVTGNV